jgi:hypothetical protein
MLGRLLTRFRSVLPAASCALLAACLPHTQRVAAVPTNLTATGGDHLVTLSWSQAFGASSYNVKRSSSIDGPFERIATTGSPLYSDSAVVNGDAYYYVVSSVAPDGESADSVRVSAFPDVSNPPPSTFGTWTNVTPAGVNLTSTLCSNFGATNVQTDPANPSHVYVQFHCQGIWKSTDYGVHWTGPINTGTNGTVAGDCSGGITIPRHNAPVIPTIYQACIRGSATGFWKSTDGGVNWTRYPVTPGGSRQDYYPPVVDPYDDAHLLMTGHEFDSIVESTDGGQTWTAVPLAAGMLQTNQTGFVFFIDTGDATTTRRTWLWLAEQSGGKVGTWRTSNGGTAWTKVDKNEHPLGAAQIYQAAGSRTVFMAGTSSALGPGVLRSNDYGQTWAHVGRNDNESVVIGTSRYVYALFGVPVGPGGITDPAIEIGAQPGTGVWAAPGVPPGLTQGAAQLATLNDGTHDVIIGAMWNAGVWRYVEP